MIGRLKGFLAEKNPPQVLIDVNGIGYLVDVPMSTFYHLPELNKEVTLLTHMVVREDAQILYGFYTAQERETFRMLIKVTGIGPRSALGILSGLSVTDLAHAVATQEVGRLVKVPGIGKKTAERLLLELKGKIGDDLGITPTHEPQNSTQNDIMQALLALGYSEKDAKTALKQLPADISVTEGIKQALRAIAK